MVEQNSSMAVGLKVDTNVVFLCLVMQVLDSSFYAGNRKALNEIVRRIQSPREAPHEFL